ncbi:MAG: response regulator transcription factor [Anaerolineae bacterium]|jgi:two-component system, OmpR family, KDP operon response regulator KdpE
MSGPLQDRKILVIDDEPEVLELLELFLRESGIRVATASSAAAGLRQFYTFRPDLVILDLMMPEMSGWEVCERLRDLSDVPIIMLTALSGDREIVRGLKSGADDYITKPFARDVLLARLEAILRRAGRVDLPPPVSPYDDGHLAIDLERRQVQVDGVPVWLTPTEYKLLAYLFQHADCMMTYSQVLQNVWGPKCEESVQYLHVYLYRLRQKLEIDPHQPRYLLTKAGIGCWFNSCSPLRP